MKENRSSAFAVVALTALIIGGVLSLTGCSGGSTTSDIEKVQAEAKAAVPQGLPTIPAEKASEGAHTMGGPTGGKNSAPGPALGPGPVSGPK